MERRKTEFVLRCFCAVVLCGVLSQYQAWGQCACRGDVNDDSLITWMGDVVYLYNQIKSTGGFPASSMPCGDLCDSNGLGSGDDWVDLGDFFFLAWHFTSGTGGCTPLTLTGSSDAEIVIQVNGSPWDGVSLVAPEDVILVLWTEHETDDLLCFCNFNLNVSLGTYLDDFTTPGWEPMVASAGPDGQGGIDIGGGLYGQADPQQSSTFFFSFQVPSDIGTADTIEIQPTQGSWRLVQYYDLPSVALSLTTTPWPTKARSPSPAHDATGIDILSDLSWTPGSWADSHDVYFGTNPDPSSDFQRNQTETTFDPGPLARVTTYYWRIDEVNTNGVTVGDVWNFTTSDLVPAKANNPSPADIATDVSMTTSLSWTAGTYAASHNVYFGTNPDPSSDFQENQTETIFDPGTLAPDTTYYWRIDETNDYGTRTGDVWSFTTGSDLLPNKASNPSPADGSSYVSVTTFLSWNAGANATSHDVYFGTNPDPSSAFQENQSETTFDPGPLESDTTYYWRIDEVNDYGTTTGDVWSFDTGCAGVRATGRRIIKQPLSGYTAHGFHFKTYQADRDTAWLLGWAIDISESSADSTMAPDDWPFNDGKIHSVTVDYTGMSVPYDTEMHIDVTFCLNEYNCVKFSDMYWTYSHDPVPALPADIGWALDAKPGSSAGGWIVGKYTVKDMLGNIVAIDMLGHEYTENELPSVGGLTISNGTPDDPGTESVIITNLGLVAMDHMPPWEEIESYQSEDWDVYIDTDVVLEPNSTITAAPVNVLTPNGGELLLGGSVYQITWATIVDANDVLIEFSVDNGDHWTSVEPANVGNTGTYEWQVPGLTSSECLVRISDALDPDNSDTSDDVFGIYQCIQDIPGDFNGDCYVDLSDFALFVNHWMMCANPLDLHCLASYKKEITICDVDAGYQIPLTIYSEDGYDDVLNAVIDCENHCDPSFSDVFFIDARGIILPYWIEKTGLTGTDHYAKVWIRASDNGTIYLAYGGRGAVGASSGAEVFEYFEGFSSSDQWTGTDGLIQVNATSERVEGTVDRHDDSRLYHQFASPLTGDFRFLAKVYWDSGYGHWGEAAYFELCETNPASSADPGSTNSANFRFYSTHVDRNLEPRLYSSDSTLLEEIGSWECQVGQWYTIQFTRLGTEVILKWWDDMHEEPAPNFMRTYVDNAPATYNYFRYRNADTGDDNYEITFFSDDLCSGSYVSTEPCWCDCGEEEPASGAAP